MIAESLNIPKSVVLRILKEDMVKKKLCAWIVPQPLTPEQREDRVISCHNIIVMGDTDKKVLNPLKPELNPICYFLALLGAHHFLHVSGIRVKLLTLR